MVKIVIAINVGCLKLTLNFKLNKSFLPNLAAGVQVEEIEIRMLFLAHKNHNEILQFYR